eukprot:Em0008g838a
MEWQGQVYVDTALPFGLRSAPKIFTALADLLEWIIRKRGVDHVDHYLDDFIILGPTCDSRCKRGLDVVLELCERLGVPLAMEKLEGPTTCLTFLGIEVDTEAMELRLPEMKLKSLTSTGWNGISMLWDGQKEHPDHQAWSDASGSWGCGAYWGSRWLQFPWSEEARGWSISVKEMVPVMWGCFVWGECWRGGVVRWNCDNLAVVEVITRGSSKDGHLRGGYRILC